MDTQYRRNVGLLVVLMLVVSGFGIPIPAVGQESMSLIDFPIKVDADSGEYCLIIVPDTQRYAAFFPHIFREQFRWIRDHSEFLNTKFVIHVGDVVEEGEDIEWIVADQAFTMIEDVVPFIVVPGNHDLDRKAAGLGLRGSTKFNAVFSPKRFVDKPWFGGNQGVTGDNTFSYFKAGGEEFLLLGIEYGPSDETLAWADSVVSNHDQKVILVTHCYMYDDDTRLGEGDLYSPRKSNTAWNDGEQIWEKLVEENDNIVMVLSGHVKGDGTGLLISENEEGKPVLQMLANYQFLAHGGQGWLRILKFSPKTKTLNVYTYSPWLKSFREESDQRFTLEVPWMFP